MDEDESMNLLDLEEFDEEELKKESEELLETRFLTKENAVFSRTDGGFVSLKTDDKEYKRVGFYLTFPLSNPDEYISVREADEKAKEIGIVENISVLDRDQQEMLKEQIRLRYFMPVITKITDVREEYGYAYWQVETTFGVCRFTTRMSGDVVIPLGGSKYLVKDIDGNRYELQNFEALSVQEKKRIDLFM